MASIGLRYPLFAALYCHEPLCRDAVAGLHLHVSNDQRAECYRRSDETEPSMHQRAVLAAGGGTLADTINIVWSMVTVFLLMLESCFGEAGFCRWFRLY